MNYYLSAFLTVCFGLWALSRLKYRRRNPRGLPPPPGPKGLPVIGNIFDMPKSEEWVTITDWRKKFGEFRHVCYHASFRLKNTILGDVIYVENLGQPLIFLNSYEAAADLLEQRSAIYSDRPISPMVQEL